MLRLNESTMVSGGAVGGGGGGGGWFTVTRAVCSAVPPGPVAVMWNVVDSVGFTVRCPLRSTLPIGSIVTEVAFSDDHVSVADCPALMVEGFTASCAVGCGGGGGGAAGAAGGCFLWQAASVTTAASAKVVSRTELFFTSNLRNKIQVHLTAIKPTILCLGKSRNPFSNLLAPTRLSIAAGASELCGLLT